MAAGETAGLQHFDGHRDRFSAADVYVGSHIAFGLQFGTIEKRAAFERYVARLFARRAALRAKQIDDDIAATGQPK